MSQRKFLTPEQKVSLIREHLIDGVSVSDLCDQHGISPVVFYNWQRQLFENAPACFDRKTNSANAKRRAGSVSGAVTMARLSNITAGFHVTTG